MVKEEERLKAVGYCRTAREDQRTKQLFLRQRDIIERCITLECFEFTNCFFEVGNAGEALMQAYDYCKRVNDINYLVVSNFNRLSRDIKVLRAWHYKFLELGVEVISADDKDYMVNHVSSVPEKSEGN
jgi:DNA invertase Pin-like site-specific DNA recombinase